MLNVRENVFVLKNSKLLMLTGVKQLLTHAQRIM